MADPDPSGLFVGMLRATGSLASAHVEHAQREASRDLGRLVGGLVLLVLGCLFVGCAVALGHVVAIWALREYTVLGWSYCLLALLGADVICGLILFALGRAKLRRPVLQQTRGLLRRTVQAFSQG